MVKSVRAECNKKMDYLAAFSMYKGLRSLLCGHKAIPVQPWGFQEVEAPRFQDNRQKKTVRLLALRNVRLYPPELFLILISVRG